VTILLAFLLAQAVQHPCVDDAKRLCPGVQPGQGRVAACLKEHKDQVSEDCRGRIAQFREGMMACQADVERLCPGIRAGAERHTCMQQHRDQVSPQCRQVFQQAAERREQGREAVRACRGDVQRFCKDVKPGAGRVVQCLQQHRSEISRGCAASIP
jgi:Golgi apparatus protein 1